MQEEEEASIFHAHLMFLEDHHFQDKIKSKIESGNSASWSIYNTVHEYLRAFDEIKDPYLSEKGSDLKDVGYRLLHYLGHEVLSVTKKTGILILIAIIYGATILKVGYFLTTSLFLFASYYFLGERRWILMFLLSFPFVAAFMYLLHGILDIYLRDPFLQSIGVMG